MIVEGDTDIETIDFLVSSLKEVRPRLETEKVDVPYRVRGKRRLFSCKNVMNPYLRDVMFWVYIDVPETAKVTANVDGRIIDIGTTRNFKFIFPMEVVEFIVSDINVDDRTVIEVVKTDMFWSSDTNIMFYVPELRLMSSWIFTLIVIKKDIDIPDIISDGVSKWP